MYSPKVISRRIAKHKRIYSVELKEYTPSEALNINEHLAKLLTEKGDLTRNLIKWESDFINNELAMSAYNFRYWAERYCTIPYDAMLGGGIGKIRLATSQEVALYHHIAPAEEENVELVRHGDPAEGLLFYWHKARQLFATGLTRAMMMHRMVTQRNFRCLCGAVDEKVTMEMYDRDKLIYDSLPWWMKPDGGRPKYDVKGQQLYLGALQNRMWYVSSTAKGILGEGRQFDGHHLTECATWPTPSVDIDKGIDPAIPQSANVLGIRESTANGRGNWWHENTEEARKGLKRRWRYIFIPWYIIETKYRAKPFTGWQPSAAILLHAEMVERTSPEFCGGRTVRLTREQMYWYETEHEEARRKRSLNVFLMNYCATPEESFQHTGNSAFDTELLEVIGNRCTMPESVFEVHSDGKTAAVEPTVLDVNDPRGQLLVWEMPSVKHHYVIGCDPTVGLQGWNRSVRRRDDLYTDNAVIQVMRMGHDKPDVQVAEFAAPIPPLDLAPILCQIGRLYKGASDAGEAKLIVEVYPGPGLAVMQEIVHHFGYTNFWMWQHVDKFMPTNTLYPGWYASNRAAQQMLWTKAHHYIAQGGVVINSKWLKEEMADAEIDPNVMRAKAIYGRHDDRLYSLMMALYAIHDWATMEIPSAPVSAATQPNKHLDFQQIDITYEKMMEIAEERLSGWLIEADKNP